MTEFKGQRFNREQKMTFIWINGGYSRTLNDVPQWLQLMLLELYYRMKLRLLAAND